MSKKTASKFKLEKKRPASKKIKEELRAFGIKKKFKKSDSKKSPPGSKKTMGYVKRGKTYKFLIKEPDETYEERQRAVRYDSYGRRIAPSRTEYQSTPQKFRIEYAGDEWKGMRRV